MKKIPKMQNIKKLHYIYITFMLSHFLYILKIIYTKDNYMKIQNFSDYKKQKVARNTL